jgi:imidazolonepropionase-like amidohydrolase
MTEAEVAAAMEEVRMRGKRAAAHARSGPSVQQALRHGIDIIYHASFCDEKTLDMLEAAKDRVFVVPGIGIVHALLNEASEWGINRAKAESMGYAIEWEAALKSLSAMHKRGIRVMPGGDYGFAFTPHGQNARDLEFFVRYLGFTPMEAIRSCTLYGGQIMMKPNELGLVKEGYLADLLLVDGEPLDQFSDSARALSHVGRDERRCVCQASPHHPSTRMGACCMSRGRLAFWWLLVFPLALLALWGLFDDVVLF